MRWMMWQAICVRPYLGVCQDAGGHSASASAPGGRLSLWAGNTRHLRTWDGNTGHLRFDVIDGHGGRSGGGGGGRGGGRGRALRGRR